MTFLEFRDGLSFLLNGVVEDVDQAETVDDIIGALAPLTGDRTSAAMIAARHGAATVPVTVVQHDNVRVVHVVPAPTRLNRGFRAVCDCGYVGATFSARTSATRDGVAHGGGSVKLPPIWSRRSFYETVRLGLAG